jgi:hypothetical protein
LASILNVSRKQTNALDVVEDLGFSLYVKNDKDVTPPLYAYFSIGGYNETVSNSCTIDCDNDFVGNQALKMLHRAQVKALDTDGAVDEDKARGERIFIASLPAHFRYKRESGFYEGEIKLQ